MLRIRSCGHRLDLPPWDLHMRSPSLTPAAAPTEAIASQKLAKRSSFRVTAYQLDFCSHEALLWRQEAACSKRMKRRSRHIRTRKSLYILPFACGKAFNRRSRGRHERKFWVRVLDRYLIPF
jgi:hypothetical protein